MLVESTCSMLNFFFFYFTYNSSGVIMPKSYPLVSQLTTDAAHLICKPQNSSYILIEKVQDESSGCSTLVAQPFMAKCCVPVIFWVFDHREVPMT